MTEELSSLPTSVEELNALPLSQHLSSLYQAAGKPLEPGLVLAAVALRAVQRPEVLPVWARSVEQQLVASEQDDPQAVYWNLQTDDLALVKSTGQAELEMLRRLADLVPRDSQPV